MMQFPWIKNANKIFLVVLGIQFLLGLVIAFYTDTWTEALFIGMPLVCFPIFLLIKYPYELITRITVGIAVQLLTALHIQLAFGLTEIHFEIFVVLAILSYYRDWRVITASTLVVAVHHVLFFILQSAQVGIFIFEESHLALYILVIHALFAVAEGGVLILITYKSNSEAHSAMVLSSSINEILKNSETINLAIDIDEDKEELSDFYRLMNSFRDLISQVNSVSSDVNTVSNKVSVVTTDLQSTIYNSSVHVDSIATASEELSATISEVASTASITNSLADEAKNKTLDAKQTIEDSSQNVSRLKAELSNTSNTISQLSGKCEHISKVMDAIKVVSEQTNLLALNAAIESARAGEHGRGFAVVADEVRQLAIKTRQSVEEISEVSISLISDGKSSVTQMENCLSMVEEAESSTSKACDAMNGVVNGIENVNQNIASVASATEEQSVVSQNISVSAQKLHGLSDSESESANMAFEEVTTLRENSQTLNNYLAKFKV